MRSLAAVALVVSSFTLLAATPAFAIDKVDAEELDFGELEVAQALPSEDGTTLYLIESAPSSGGAKKSRIVFWDLARGEVVKEVKVPKAPTHMALFSGK